MKDNSRPVQHSVGIYTGKRHAGTYVYKCNGCSKEVAGYYHKVVYGNVYCAECKAKNRKIYALEYWKRKIEEAK